MRAIVRRVLNRPALQGAAGVTGLCVLLGACGAGPSTATTLVTVSDGGRPTPGSASGSTATSTSTAPASNSLSAPAHGPTGPSVASPSSPPQPATSLPVVLDAGTPPCSVLTPDDVTRAVGVAVRLDDLIRDSGTVDGTTDWTCSYVDTGRTVDFEFTITACGSDAHAPACADQRLIPLLDTANGQSGAAAVAGVGERAVHGQTQGGLDVLTVLTHGRVLVLRLSLPGGASSLDTEIALANTVGARLTT